MMLTEIKIHKLPIKDETEIERTLYALTKQPNLTDEEEDWVDWAEAFLLDIRRNELRRNVGRVLLVA